MRLKKTEEEIFIHQSVYLFLRLIENHDHADLQQSRKDEVRFVSRLFDKFPNSWIGIGRDFIRLFQHLYPIESFTQYWGLIDNDPNSTKLTQILNMSTNPKILQICISKHEEKDLVNLCADIMVYIISYFLVFTQKHLFFKKHLFSKTNRKQLIQH